MNVGNVAELALREALAQVADVLVHAEGHEVPGERCRQRLQQANLHGSVIWCEESSELVGRWSEGQRTWWVW